jgi:hypothetical protein
MNGGLPSYFPPPSRVILRAVEHQRAQAAVMRNEVEESQIAYLPALALAYHWQNLNRQPSSYLRGVQLTRKT